MLHRRAVLKLAATGLGAVAVPAIAQPATIPATAPAPGVLPFDATQVTDAARALATKPFVAPAVDLPVPFAKLSYEQYVGIRQKPGSALWAGDNLGFALEPLPRGFIFSAPMVINLVEDGQAHRLAFDPGRFDFGGLQVPTNLPDIGYSGFRVLQPHNNDGLHDVAIFQGASFFRAIATGQNFGVTARALSIRTADPHGEEFPAIREVWIERPTLAANALVVHALLDSESVTGAYRFTLRPGDLTIIDTESTLFTRTAVDGFGLGTMPAMSFFGPQTRHGTDDVREGVYDIGGLQVLNANGEWLWRSVTNRDTLQLSAFINDSPRGFGMLQRERSFDQFQDDDQHWELRPSLWIEPLSEWGEGSVVLVEIPTDSEVNDNIVCFWRPKAPLAAKAEASFNYRQFWGWTPPDRPSLAVVTDTRLGRVGSTRRRAFIVEFSSEAFADPARTADLKAMLTTSAGTVSAIRTFESRTARTFRVHFELDPAGESLAELRMLLEAAGKPASETWLYRWTS